MRAPAATAAARRSDGVRAPARRATVKRAVVRAPERRTHPARPRRSPAPRIARRVSGPGRGRARPAVAPRSTRLPWPVRAILFVRALPDRRPIEWMARGRGWILVLGFLLMGIVAMQVSLLKLNAGIGRDVERAAYLERTNGELRAQVSRLSSGERIQVRAGALGMVMPPAGAVSYLRTHGPRDAQAAVRALREGKFAPGAAVNPAPGLPPAPDSEISDEPTASTGPSEEAVSEPDSESGADTESASVAAAEESTREGGGTSSTAAAEPAPSTSNAGAMAAPAGTTP